MKKILFGIACVVAAVVALWSDEGHFWIWFWRVLFALLVITGVINWKHLVVYAKKVGVIASSFITILLLWFLIAQVIQRMFPIDVWNSFRQSGGGWGLFWGHAAPRIVVCGVVLLGMLTWMIVNRGGFALSFVVLFIILGVMLPKSAGVLPDKIGSIDQAVTDGKVPQRMRDLLPPVVVNYTQPHLSPATTLAADNLDNLPFCPPDANQNVRTTESDLGLESFDVHPKSVCTAKIHIPNLEGSGWKFFHVELRGNCNVKLKFLGKGSFILNELTVGDLNNLQLLPYDWTATTNTEGCTLHFVRDAIWE